MCKITKENDSLQRQTENKDEDSQKIQGNKNIPELRFPEFEGEWIRNTLNKVIISFINGKTPSRDNNQYWDGDIPWVSSGELNYNHITQTNEKITKDGQNSANLQLLSKNTFLIAVTGLEASGTRGSCAILDIEATTNQSCMALIPNPKKLSMLFLYYWYLKKGEKYGIKYTQGTKQQSYNIEILKKLPITIPLYIEEQEKIANFLSAIDKKIELMEKKLNFWKKLKKYYITRILNHTSEYKIRNVENIIKVIGSKKYQIKKTEIKNKGKYVVVDQSKDYVAGFHNDKNKVFFDIPIIIFGDHTTVLKYIEKPFIVGGDGVKILKPKIDINLKYLYYNLISNNIHSEGYKRHFGILKKKDIKIINDKKIQKTIGDLLYNIDRIIKYRSSKLKQLKYFKKGLLQKMFC